MSLDRSLKTSGKLSQKRSVLTRAERIAKAAEVKRVAPTDVKPLGLAKTRVK